MESKGFWYPTTIFLTFLIIFLWFLELYWKNRRVYKLVENIPGPKSYPLIGNYLDFISGKSTYDFLNTFIRYFSTFPDVFKFWLGPNLYVGITNPEHVEIVLNHPECQQKGMLYDFLEPFMGQGLLTAPVNIWRRNRKLILPAFNQKILNSFVEVFNEHAKTLVKTLETEIGKEFDIFDHISACNVDTICETAMGVKVNAQNTGNEFGKILDTLMESVCYRMFYPWLGYDSIYRLSKYAKIVADHLATLEKFITGIIVEKRKLFSDRKRRIESGEIIEEKQKWKTFLEILLELSDGNLEYTNKELMDEVNTFVAAGSDTVAASLCFCCTTMGMHPELQEKLYEEVLEALGEDREATFRDLHRLEYMDRFIKENLRLFPVGPLIVRTPADNLVLDDVVIPAKCSIMIGVLYLHRSAEHWSNPLKFDPDRFLPEEVAKRHPYCYLPFSGGPRGCIGPKYGEMAMKSILCTLIRKFVFKTEYKSIKDIDLKANLLLRPVNGYRVSVEARE